MGAVGKRIIATHEASAQPDHCYGIDERESPFSRGSSVFHSFTICFLWVCAERDVLAGILDATYFRLPKGSPSA